jgi:hypothetical protein
MGSLPDVMPAFWAELANGAWNIMSRPLKSFAFYVSKNRGGA